MKILHVDTGREMRGGQWQALMLVRQLLAAGEECAVLARPGSLLQGECEREGIAVYEASALTLRSLSGEADLVHCHDGRSHTLAALFSRAPFVVSRRVGFPVGRGLAHRWKYSRPARYLAISNYVAKQLESAGVPPAVIDVTPDAVPVPAQVSSLEGPLLTIASDDPGKGNALVRRAGIPVRFSSDILSDLPHARGLIYISEMEGLGSGALLAMAWGVPVVASRVGGLPEIVIDGETGITVDNDPGQIAAAAARLLEDRDLAARFGAGGRRMVEERFTLESMTSRTIECYRKALSGVATA